MGTGKHVKKGRRTFRARRESGYWSEYLPQRSWRKKLKSTRTGDIMVAAEKGEIT
jgi:hypothetical protein